MPIFMVAFGLIYAYANRDVRSADMLLVTPATIALIALSVILALRLSIRGDVDERTQLTVGRMRRPVLLLLSTGILLIGSGWDFPIAAGVFLLVAMRALGVRDWRVILPVSVMAPLVLHLAFTGIGVPLPSFWLRP